MCSPLNRSQSFSIRGGSIPNCIRCRLRGWTKCVHSFVQKFVTGLLGVADDMERALESVPADAQQQKDPAALLKGLRDGITLTHKTLEKVCPAGRFAHMMPATLHAIPCMLSQALAPTETGRASHRCSAFTHSACGSIKVRHNLQIALLDVPCIELMQMV